jgi:hypothetical protein
MIRAEIPIAVPASIAPTRKLSMTPDFERILEKCLEIDAFKEYERLSKSMKLGEQRNDYHALRMALDEAEENAQIAHTLGQNSIIEKKRLDIEYEVITSAMWSRASSDLEEYSRKKNITDTDVRKKCAELFPDEWAAQVDKQARITATVAQMEKLTWNFNQRCGTLRALLETLRR